MAEALDLRTVSSFCLSGWVSGALGSLDSASGSQAERERELWLRPGTCRATFVLGADCGRQRVTPSGPGRKGTQACARPWKPRLLPVSASSRRKQSLERAGRSGRDFGGSAGPDSAEGGSGLGYHHVGSLKSEYGCGCS